MRAPWLVAVPGLLLVLGFHLVPTVAGTYYAFTDWTGLSSPNWVGLANFREIFSDPVMRGALRNTILLAAVFIVFVNGIGLMLALALNRTLKTRHILRSLLFAPVIISQLAVAFIWQYIFDFTGPLNRLLGAVGREEWQQPWLGSPRFALWTVLVVLVWQYAGLAMIIYLAGLQNISDELLEAATVDGAGSWLRFRRIVLPLLAPALTVTITLTTILGLRVFDQVIALTDGGPAGASETLATQVYKQTFVNGRFGEGTALAVVLTVLISVVAFTQLVILRRREVAT